MGSHRLSAVRRDPVFLDLREHWPWLVFFLALVVLGPASAWRHLAPDNASLAWDRLAMSLVFMSWFAAHLAERIGVRFGLNTLPVLLRGGSGRALLECDGRPAAPAIYAPTAWCVFIR